MLFQQFFFTSNCLIVLFCGNSFPFHQIRWFGIDPKRKAFVQNNVCKYKKYHAPAGDKSLMKCLEKQNEPQTDCLNNDFSTLFPSERDELCSEIRRMNIYVRAHKLLRHKRRTIAAEVLTGLEQPKIRIESKLNIHELLHTIKLLAARVRIPDSPENHECYHHHVFRQFAKWEKHSTGKVAEK